MTQGASLSSFSFLFSILITSKRLISHQYMLLTWLLPRSPFALSPADPGPRQWLWTIVASDIDGSWSWWLLTIDYDCSRTAWYIIFLLRYSTITNNNPSIHWPSVMRKRVYSNQCCKYPCLDNVLLYTWNLLHFCPSWERDPSHVALSLRFLRSFYHVKRFF